MRRTPTLLIVLALVLAACGGDGELGGPAIGGTPAAKVGGWELTNAELRDEVEDWAGNPTFLAALGLAELGDPGRRGAEVTGFVLSHRILAEQARQLAAAQGYAPSDDEVDQVLSSIWVTVSPAFGEFPDEFQRRIATDLAYQQSLEVVFGPNSVAPAVEVNPRYGIAVDVQSGLVQVDAPAGPLAAPGTS